MVERLAGIVPALATQARAHYVSGSKRLFQNPILALAGYEHRMAASAAIGNSLR